MSKRKEIIEGSKAAVQRSGLIYTEVLGWVDLGHARGTDVRNLLASIAQGEASGRAFYDVTYAQGMTSPWKWVRSGKRVTWKIKHGRPGWEQKSIALAMMMTVARRFETFQAAFPSLITDSGFSGEDLVSDLLGFYRVVSVANPFPLLRPVSRSEALKRWDHYGKVGNWKNETFRPLLFPDPEKCPGARPYKGVLPSFMTTIVPYNDFLSGNVILPRQDKTFIEIGVKNARTGL